MLRVLQRVELPAILLVLLAATLLVQPSGDFPLNDDENHAIGTWNFARSGHFRFAIDTTPPLRAQVVWGAIWTRLFGESFDVLRASTLVLTGLTLLLVNRLLAMAGFGLGLRWLATLAFLFNPIYFWSSFTYMTEGPYVFASVLALFCFVLAFRRESTIWFIAGCAAVAVSWWIRQGAINLVAPLVILIAYRERLTRKWRTQLAIATAVGIGYVAMGLLRRDLVVASPMEFHFHYMMWSESSFRLPQMLSLAYSYFFFNAQHLAVLFLPLAVAALFALPACRERWQRITLGVVAALMLWRMATIVSQHVAWPYYGRFCCDMSHGSVVSNFSLGPPTLGDVWSGMHDYPFHLSFPTRVVATVLLVLVAAGALTLLIVRLRDAIRRVDALYLLGAIGIAAGTVTLLVSGQYVDRYALDTAWAAGLLLPFVIPWNERRARVTAAILLLAVALFSIFSMQEYFAWNRARWTAYWELRNGGAGVKEIDGGAEPYLFYELSQARDIHERRRMGFGSGPRKYVLAFGPLPGYRVIGQKAFKGWLGWHRGAVLIEVRTQNAE